MTCGRALPALRPRPCSDDVPARLLPGDLRYDGFFQGGDYPSEAGGAPPESPPRDPRVYRDRDREPYSRVDVGGYY